MIKTSRITKTLVYIFYITVILILMLKREQIAIFYNIPEWIIPAFFYINFIYICYKYTLLSMKEGKLEADIISTINHAFRTPITGILWYAKELENNLPQNEKLLHLQNLRNSANKLLNIVDVLVGIKSIKNTSGYVFEAISIREIIEKSIKKYREKIAKKNITFQVSTFKDIPLLTVDLKKISFVIDNIIENAVYYTKQDGKILIDCISNSNKLILFVSDTGIGLGFFDKMMIFSKFYRNKQAKLMNTDGMGLKLYLSKEVIKRHRGKIYAKSNGINEGATFFIEIPFRH